ncbi:MAG: hypothetical protein HOI29_05350 [Planctomycetes bacterium]|nr:hypothetical protein [Planctomycetota bacterium]
MSHLESNRLLACDGTDVSGMSVECQWQVLSIASSLPEEAQVKNGLRSGVRSESRFASCGRVAVINAGTVRQINGILKSVVER